MAAGSGQGERVSHRRAEKYENGERRHCLENCQSGVPGGPILGGGAATPEPDAVRAGDELDTLAVPGSGAEAPVKTTRGAKRGYVVPKEPFLLDPLL